MSNAENSVCTKGIHRIRVPIRLPVNLLEVIDKTCIRQEKNRTAFIENAIREKLNSLNVRIQDNNSPKFCTDEDLAEEKVVYKKLSASINGRMAYQEVFGK